MYFLSFVHTVYLKVCKDNSAGQTCLQSTTDIGRGVDMKCIEHNIMIQRLRKSTPTDLRTCFYNDSGVLMAKRDAMV